MLFKNCSVSNPNSTRDNNKIFQPQVLTVHLPPIQMTNKMLSKCYSRYLSNFSNQNQSPFLFNSKTLKVTSRIRSRASSSSFKWRTRMRWEWLQISFSLASSNLPTTGKTIFNTSKRQTSLFQHLINSHLLRRFLDPRMYLTFWKAKALTSRSWPS